jgi:MFS transporter, CP family, cyanate transporter
VLMPGWPVVAWAGLIGFSVAAGLILVLALPPLLSVPEDVHRLASAMFTISYPCAVLMSVLGGYLWDATAISWIAFAPIAFCAAALAILPLGIDLGGPPRAMDTGAMDAGARQR